MGQKLRLFIVLGIFGLLVSPFTNCASSIDQGQDLSANELCTTDCESNSPQLEIKFHLESYKLTGDKRSIEVGGFCNEGPFYNSNGSIHIQWGLVIPGVGAQLQNNIVTCENGYFKIEIIHTADLTQHGLNVTIVGTSSNGNTQEATHSLNIF